MFSEKIKELRILNNYTQQYVADYLSVKRPTYTRYEIGTNQPDFETIVKLSNLFKVSTDYLLGVPENEQKKIRPSEDERILNMLAKSDELRRLVDLWDKLTPEELKSLADYTAWKASQLEKEHQESTTADKDNH